MKQTKRIKKQKGITLIILVVTIVVLLILSGVTFNSVLGQNGIINKSKQAVGQYEKTISNELQAMNKTEKWLEEQMGAKNEGTLIPPEIPDVEEPMLIGDGTYNEELGINTPKLMTGMTPVSWDSSNNEFIPTKQMDWYDYNTNKWANVKTEDGSYWVWIPRYEYKIISGEGTSVAGIIDIKFIKNKETIVTGGYKIHPAFGTDINNGGWSSHLDGIWVAKYVAGFQKSTIDTNGNPINSTDTVQYSSLKYTSYGSYTTNALGQDLTSTGYSSQKISYPVFKPQTYAYNVISSGDAYRISRQIASTTSIYGLNDNQTDSHMMKNSEWGAVTYLTWSRYGRNGVEPNINNLSLNNRDSKTIYSVTGFSGLNSKAAVETNIANVNGYKTNTGILASSTGNVTGIYDLNGCIWERTSGYIYNGNNNLTMHGSSYATNGTSTKYATVYPYNIASDSEESNRINFKNNYSNRYGDSIRETSSLLGTASGWNLDGSSFPGTTVPFFIRRGKCY